MNFYTMPILLFIMFEAGVDPDYKQEALMATYNARTWVNHLLGGDFVFLCEDGNNETDFWNTQNNKKNEIIFAHFFGNRLDSLFGPNMVTETVSGIAFNVNTQRDIYINLETTLYNLIHFSNVVKIIAHEMLHLFGFQHESKYQNIMHPYPPGWLSSKRIGGWYNWLLPNTKTAWDKAVKASNNKENREKMQAKYYYSESDNCN